MSSICFPYSLHPRCCWLIHWERTQSLRKEAAPFPTATCCGGPFAIFLLCSSLNAHQLLQKRKKIDAISYCAYALQGFIQDFKLVGGGGGTRPLASLKHELLGGCGGVLNLKISTSCQLLQEVSPAL